jgi:Caspase domain
VKTALALAALLLPAGVWSTPAAAAGRELLAIGSNVGLPHELVLAHAVEDARRMAELLNDIGGVDRARTQVLADPTPAQVLKALAVMAGRSAHGDAALVYFSGHGDEGSLHLAGERLSLEQLAAAVAALNAPLKVVIVDACRATEVTDKGLARGQSFAVDVQSSPNRHRGLVTLLASSSGEMAQESRQLGGGVFTYFLLSGLRGSADGDNDHRVTLVEAYEFAFKHTLARSVASTGVAQRPEVRLDVEGTGPLYLTTLDPADARLVLPAGSDTHYYVYEKGSAAAVVEAWGQHDQATTLALRAGRYVVQRQAGNDTGVAQVTLPSGGEASLRAAAFVPIPPESMLGRGGRFEIHPHLLVLSGGVTGGGSLHLAPTVAAWYGVAHGDLLVHGGLALTAVDQRTVFNDFEQRRLELVVGAGRQWVGRHITAYALGDLVARFERQRTADWRVDSRSPEWVPPDRIDDRLAAGLGARFAVALPIAGRLAMLLEASARAFAFRQRQSDRAASLIVEPDIGLRAGFVTSF